MTLTTSRTVPAEARPSSRPSVTRRRIRPTGLGPAAWAAVAFLAIVLLAAVAPTLLTSADPYATDPGQALQAPSAEHLFGTDQSGRDVLARIVHGARDSLLIGGLATVLSVLIGTTLGLAAGLGGPRVDAVVSRFVEVLFAFPSLLLALLVLTIFGSSVVTTTVAVGIALSPGLARLVRGQALVVRESGYVEAARVLGHGRVRVLARSVTPNVLRPLLSYALLHVGSALIWAMTLSFFGFGARPPAPEWGAMLADAHDVILFIWWLPVFTGLAIILTAASATVLGRSLQARLAGRGAR